MGLVLTLDAEQNTELRAGLELREEQVKQYGNAVTPPVMRELVRRAVESLAA